ncbi:MULTISPECIES: energy transducer TonB family protein [unclassified Sphingomonas]|uniref:energy transducer TonB n=1 Tax=Novosphingobium rhizosphaerae TaxID=1551649 RepID=UPI0015CD3DC8
MAGLSAKARGNRIAAASVAAGLEILLALLLLFGLAPPHGAGEAMRNGITAITLSHPPAAIASKPPPPQPHHPHATGKAAPAALRAQAAPVFAAVTPWAKPPPIPVAPQVALGLASHSGAALVPGPGNGAGGQGNGTGSGTSGTGDGDGGSDPEWTGGKIKSSDYPPAARAAQAQGTTSVTISVTAQGRPSACRVTQSSRNPALDATTCDLAMKRFRFRPARDASGRAVAGEVDYDQEWTMGILSDAP